jgi:glycosyltransferase involved in cell wall biosynthesis
MDEPLVSIIIPAYNSGKYIKECLDSVMNQTYKNWEAIVVYSPSKDDTIIVLEDYLFEKRINLIIEKNKSNCATARNIGIANAKGKYIAMLDSDDWIESEKLEVMVSFMESHPKLMWSAHYVDIHYPNGTIYHEHIYPGQTVEVGGVGAILFRSDFLTAIETHWGYIFYEKMDRADDGDLVLRIRNESSGLIKKMLSHYRWNEEGLSANTTGINQSKIMIGSAIRNHAWDILPTHLKNYLVCILNEVTGIDWVAEKKRLFG